MSFFYFITFSGLILIVLSFQEWKLEKLYNLFSEKEHLSPGEKAQIEFTYLLARGKYQTFKIILVCLMLFMTMLFMTILNYY